MLRAAMLVLIASGLVVSTGCNKPKKPDDTQSADMYGGGYDTGYQSPASLTGMSSDETYTADSAAGGQRIHVVAKGDTLYSLARQYYGNQSKWRDIYTANQSQLADPNQIKVGQKLVIP